MGNRIRALREASRLTLDEAGRRAGIERTKLSRAERDYVRLKPEEEERLAPVYGVNVERLRDDTAA